MSNRARLTSLSVMLLPALSHPVQAQLPAFEVASIRPHIQAGKERSSIDSSPGLLRITNDSVSSCIKWAWRVQDYQIAGPEWLVTEKFDIAAKAAGPAPMDELRKMLQTLLADRFQLLFHRETRVLPVYGLTVTKSGPKLHKAEPGGHTDMRAENGSFVFRGTSMEQFADDLAVLRNVDRPVLDRTGIPGVFDFSLKFGDTSGEMKRALVADDGVSIFTVMPEQLGLRLEPDKGAIEMLVIDHIARTPTEN